MSGNGQNAAGCTHPDVGKHGAVGALAVAVKVLCDDGGDGHGDADEAVVVDADPVDVEPRQTAGGSPPRAALGTAAGGEPVQGPHPLLDGVHVAEEVLLLVQVGGHVVAHEGEEGGDGEGLVAVGHDLKVDGMLVEVDLQEGRGGVYGDHEEDTDDAETVLAGWLFREVTRRGRTVAAHPVWCN